MIWIEHWGCCFLRQGEPLLDVGDERVDQSDVYGDGQAGPSL